MSNIALTAVSPMMAPLLWDSISDMIDKALEHSNGELDIDTMKKKIINGDMLLVLVHKDGDVIAAITFEKRVFDTGKRILMVTTAGGDHMEEWIDQLNDFGVALAKERDCEDIYIIGRPGWAKTLKSAGFTVQHTVLSKKVGG